VGRASSSKKVAKAAASGSKVRTPRQTGLLFPGALAAVLILGLALIVYGKGHRANSNTVPPLANAQDDPLGRGHWHAAYGMYDCDHFLQPITNQNDSYNGVPIGIHTHGDGIIHIHPFTTSASGRNAKLGWFAKTTGFTLTDTVIDVSAPSVGVGDGKKMSTGDTCTVNGKQQTAKLKIAVWETRHAAKPVIYTSGFRNIAFTANEMLFTMALVPDGVDIPKPVSEPVLDKLTDTSSGAATTTTAPTGVTTTTVFGPATTLAGSPLATATATSPVPTTVSASATATTAAGPSTSKG